MLPNTYDDDDSLGVRRDTLVDARIDVQSDLSDLQTIHLRLDSVADDREGIWSDLAASAIRRQQATVQDLIAVGEDHLADIDDELARVKQELADDEHSGPE